MNKRLAETIERMGQVLRTSEDALGHLNCGEFQPIAEVLVLAGYVEAARDVIRGHSAGDNDIEDHHHALYELEDPSREGTLLDGFVREIQTGEPIQKWRNVFGEQAHSMEYYTRYARDEHAGHLAKAYRRNVLSFGWDATNPQDDPYQGWMLEVVVVAYVPE
jgi:hypothetical protein